ncbi:MAG: chemotaxis histidine kinase/response regulator CheAY2 [Flammeovirgaceae bacterium]
MKSKEEEFKEIFLAEALDQYEELNRLFTVLEKNHQDKQTVEAVFRTTHTLKANAAAMGFEPIANLAHLLEDIFSEIKQDKMTLTPIIFNELFRANDKLGELINSIKTGESIHYKGLVAKLKVILQRGREATERQKNNANEEPKTSSQTQHLLQEEKKQPIAQKIENTQSLTIQEETQPLEMLPQQKTTEQEIQKIDEPIEQTYVQTSEKAKETEKTELQKPETDKKEEKILEKMDDFEQKNTQKAVQQSSAPENVLITHTDVETLAEELKEEVHKPQITFSDLVQVPVKKLDNLLNLVGELAIEKDRLMTVNKSASELASLHRITSDLQYSVMGVRLVQVSVLFQKFHRIVRDVATYENKKVNLVLEGTEVEIDRNILQIISDSMIHLVRNAISHGIELPEERLKVGKSDTGVLRLKAHNEKDHVVIDVEDDGKGIDPKLIRRKALEKGMLSPNASQKMSDEEVIRFIFEPGFSSADKITDVSGRGVGMDVVKKSIDAIGGKITMQSEVGKGTRFSLSLPASMAVKSVLLFELKDAEFAIPLAFTEAVISLKKTDIRKVGAGLMATYQDKTMSVVFLNDIFDVKTVEELKEPKLLHRSFDTLDEQSKIYLIVVSMYNHLVGFVVDKLLQQKEILERPLKPPVENARFISGATIMGNGNVCLVLDVSSVIDFLFKTIAMKD